MRRIASSQAAWAGGGVYDPRGRLTPRGEIPRPPFNPLDLDPLHWWDAYQADTLTLGGDGTTGIDDLGYAETDLTTSAAAGMALTAIAVGAGTADLPGPIASGTPTRFYQNIASVADLFKPPEGITLFGIVPAAGLTTSGAVYQFAGFNTGNELGIRSNSSGGLSLYCADDGAGTYTSPVNQDIAILSSTGLIFGSPTPGAGAHAVYVARITTSSARLLVYRDRALGGGVQVEALSGAHPLISELPANRLAFGGRTQTSGPWVAGYLHTCMWWTRELSDEEVAQLVGWAAARLGWSSLPTP